MLPADTSVSDEFLLAFASGNLRYLRFCLSASSDFSRTNFGSHDISYAQSLTQRQKRKRYVEKGDSQRKRKCVQCIFER